ncbi:TonB family protein [Janthinobacterium sp. NKUCC06_STL]|uniref:TonB family protein n=1 Tax=Janthinobacterium sp. NKUCC06_STL TaxID=2842127 RepID=UPI001C5B86BC|nr:TonB family protein [Janthinobacterium sp. NKUCC06_STL]MBW3507508.1 TonB family protein [Janthinobacterium sp. NKUCC06_STL]
MEEPVIQAVAEAHTARLRRWAWTGAGMLMVALGVIGAMLPVMPTTIFLILALACFSRASPRLEHWLLHHPRFGAPLRQWREHRAVSRRGKVLACLGMAIGFVAMCLGHPPWWVIVLVATMEIAVIIYLLRRPEGPAPAPEKTPPADWHKPLTIATVFAMHGALLGWALYHRAPAAPLLAIAPDSAQPAMLYLPAAAPPRPLEQNLAERVSAAAAPSRSVAKKAAPAIRQFVLPQPDAAPMAPQAESIAAVAEVRHAPVIPAPAAAPSIATAPPSPALPPAPQELRSGVSSWEGKVLARMERFRRYPTASRAKQEQGVVYLRCRIDRDGQVLAAAIERSSGSAALDQAALDTLQRAAPLPRIPKERPDPLELSIPVEFSIG